MKVGKESQTTMGAGRNPLRRLAEVPAKIGRWVGQHPKATGLAAGAVFTLGAGEVLPAFAQEPTVEPGSQVLEAPNTVRVRSEASTRGGDSTILEALPAGTQVMVVDVDDAGGGGYDWKQITQVLLPGSTEWRPYSGVGYVAADGNGSTFLNEVVTPRIAPIATAPAPGETPPAAETQAPAGEVLNEIEIPAEVATRTYDNKLDGYVVEAADGTTTIYRELVEGDTRVVPGGIREISEFGTISLEVPNEWGGDNADANYSFFDSETANTTEDLRNGLEAFWLTAYQMYYEVDEDTARQYLQEDRPVTFYWTRDAGTSLSRSVNTIFPEQKIAYQIKPSEGASVIVLPGYIAIPEGQNLAEGPYERISSPAWYQENGVFEAAYPMGFSATAEGGIVLVTDFKPSVAGNEQLSNMSNSQRLSWRFADLLYLVGRDGKDGYARDGFFFIDRMMNIKSSDLHVKMSLAFGLGNLDYADTTVYPADRHDQVYTEAFPLITPTPTN